MGPSVKRAWFLVIVFASACKRDPDAGPRPTLTTPPNPTLPIQAVLRERSGLGRIVYLGADIDPKSPERGKPFTLTHYFKVEKHALGDYDVFVHGDLPGGGGRVLSGDHAPMEGRFPTSRW